MKNNSLKRLMAAALCLCMLLSLYVPSVSAETVSYDEMSFSQILASQESLTWVICGDSITHNGSWSQGMNSYGEWIEQYLRSIGRKDSVILSGVGGAKLEDLQPNATTRNGISVGTDDFITKFNPDVVTIKLGMNNRPADETSFKSMYNAMLDEVYRAAATNGKKPKVVILTSPPLSGENTYDLDVPGQDSVNRQVAWLNSIAANYNATNGTHIQVVDLRNAFTNERLVLGDAYYQTFFFGPSDGAIHPNAAGQYLIFKTVAKTLGFYDSSKAIFNHEYQDLNEGNMYVDSTYISDYSGSYGAVTDVDGEEMNKTMPGLEKNTQPVLIASVDFTDQNGTFVGGNNYAGATRIDMTDTNVMDDALTLAEVQALGTEFSVIFRAKLNASNNNNQPILFVSAAGTTNWNNAIALGAQGKADQIYYEIRSGGTELTNSPNTPSIDANKTAVNGQWHTIAYVQSANDLRYYVDGVLVATKAYKLNDGKTIGSVFANATKFVAHIGSYGENAGSYQLDGKLDYYQLYNGALSAAEVATLTSNGGNVDDATQMNKTMPTVTDVNALASVDFTSATGVFAGTDDYASSTRVDLTDETVVDDALTLEEVQGMGREFSLVLRARLDSTTHQMHQALLMLTPGTDARWTNAISIGGPGTANNLYYEVRQTVGETTSELTNSSNVIGLAATTPNVVDAWHTIAIVQRTDGLDYYIDGVLAESKSYKLKDGLTFGDLFTDATEFTAHVGSFAQGDAKTYNLKAKLDYYQFYGTALTAAQVESLGSGVVSDADQMNATMPTLPAVEYVPNLLASVDFDSTNGELDFGNSAGLRIDTATDGYAINTLTQAEAATLGTDFSVIFRAKLNCTYQSNQPVLYISSNGTDNWNNALVLGVPGKPTDTVNNQLYYSFLTNDKLVVNKAGQINFSGDAINGDNKWHTVAVTNKNGTITLYVDGTQIGQATGYGLKDGITSIGSQFANSTDFAVQIGRYGFKEDGTSYKLKGDFDYWQLYDGVLSASQIQKLTAASGEAETTDAAEWSDMDTDNANWAIAGGTQLIGYQGSVSSRSLLRLIENTIRNCSGWTNRDIHVIPFAADGYDPEYLADNYNTIVAGHNYNVFMLLPEVPDVYAYGYSHSADLVAAYKADIQTLMANNSNKVKVLWSPLASNNDTINTYITAYAEAVREIAANDATILFFDANKFMNERMAANYSLKTNWFEEGMNISPLCAMDLTTAFYVHAGISTVTMSELKAHNLRLSSDTRPLKDTVRDYIVPGVSVSGSSITVDASSILSAYSGLSNLRVAVLKAYGVGTDHHGNWEDIAYFNGASTVTFTAPWSNPVVTVLGDLNGYTYRFKDVSTAATGASLTVEHYTDGLTGLEVVGAPAIGFDPDTAAYNVELYQYQRNVQIRAQGGDNLAITVNGVAVKAGALSQQIAVDGSATVTVAVSGGAADKTYTLNLTRPANADIIITEVQQASSSSDLYDLVEIYNASGEELNLLDYALGYKKDYTDSVYTTQNMGKYPYYFTGDDQAFNSRNGSTQTYTGINQITKNSTFWSGDNVVTEPDYIPFPADSTMVLWVKYSNDKSADATYGTLMENLKGSTTTYTLPDGTKIVPTSDIIALAERPSGVSASGATNTASGKLPTNVTTFHLENHNKLTDDGGADNSTRSWLFVLKDTAVRDDNASITEAGDDIISAAMFVRPTNSLNMSTVLYYDTVRGMALVKNPVSYGTDANGPYYSSQYSYSNYTTFGAVEYWQKPYDFGDTAAPSIENKTPAGVLSGDDATIELVINEQEDGDIRYLELYVDTDNDGTYETVVKKDITLITSATNGGKAKDVVSHTETLSLTDLTNTVKYYGFVLDGNNNKAWLGSDTAPMTIEIVEPGQLRVNVNVLNEAGEASDAEIEVSITLSKGDSLINIGGNYVVYNAEGASVGNLNGGSGSVTVSNGEALIVKNLPEGAAYTLRVAVPNGYKDLTPTDNLTGKIGTTEGATTVSAQKILLTGNLTVSADIERVNGDSSSADTKATVVITLAKGSSPVELAESYVVEDLYTVKLGETVDNTITLSLADGQQATVIGLPVGAVYTVTATAPDGYEDKTTGSTNSALTSVDGATVALSFKEILVIGDLTVGASVKKVDGTASDKKATVKIDLTQGTAGIAPTGTYQVVNDSNEPLGTVENGTATVTLADGEKAIIKNLPVGTKYTISVTVPEGYENITQTALDGNVAEGGSIAAVAVKEKLITGGLTVNAVIKKVDGADSAEKVTVKIQLAKGDSPVNLEPSYTVVNGSGTELGTTTNGAITVTLGNGEKAVIADLPAGAAYTLTVTTPEGYANESTDATTGNVSANGSSVTVGMKELLVTGNLTVNATVKEVDDSASAEKITVKIDLTKGNAPIDLEATYAIVDGAGASLGTITNGTATIQLANGQKAIVKDVAEGAAYTVTVTAPEGYENTTTGTTTGNVVKTGSAVDVSAKELLVTGDLTVNATVKKVDGADSVQKVTVKIDLTKGNAPIALENTYKIVDGSGKELGTVSNGTATIELTNGQTAIVKDVAEGAAYTVTVTAPEGYENTTTGATTGNVVKTGSAVTVSVKELLVTGNLTVNAAVKKVDGATSSEKITVKIELVKNKAPIDLEPSYDIVDGTGTKIGEVKNGTATIELTDGQQAIVKNVAAGAKFTLTVTVPNGYEDLTQRYSGNVVQTGTTVEVSVKEKLVTGDLTVNAEAKRVDNTASTEKITVKIDLTKGNAPINLEASYDIVDGSGTKIGTVTNGTATVELTNGQKAIVKDVAVGAAYTVTVTAPENYQNTTAGATTGNVAETGSAVTVSVKELLVTGNLTVNAEVKKVDSTASSEKVTVKIDLTKDNAPVDLEASYDIVDGSGTKIGEVKNGTATIELTNGQKAIVKDVAVGAKFTVTVTAPSGYNDLTETTTGNVVKAGSTVNVSVKEKLITGTLTVNAEAKRVDNSASAEKITVKIKLAKGDAPVGLATTYTVVDGSGNELGKTSNGEITVKLENGEKAVITGLPAGAAYTVTVTAPENYQNTTAGATTGNVAETGSAVTVSVKELLVTGNLTVNATVKEVDGDVSSEKVTVKIDLTKDNAPVDLEASYDIVDGSGTKIGEVKNGTATIEMTNGQKAIVKDVAVGAKFTVTVTAPDGYDDLTQNGNGNVVKAGSTVSVSVKEKLVTGTLTVKMDLNDCAGADADSSVKASLKIKVTKGDAAVALNASYDILNNKGVKIGTLANGEATVELANGGIAKIDGLPAGASYTVTVTVPEGYDDITTGATTGKVAAAGSDVTIALQEQVKEGQFYISASVKKVDGSASTAKATVVITLAKTNAPVDLADSYDILDENGTKIGSTANGTATLSMADGDKAVIKGLPEGASYSVKITAPTGYEDKTSAAATTGIIGTDSGAVACEVAEILKTGEVSVTAELKTEDGETVTDEKVTVTVTLSKGLSPVELAASYDIVNAKGEKIGTVSNGVATFKLASGDKATIKDLPQGAAFVVSLTTPEGYENTTTGTTSGNIAATPIVVSLKVTEKAPTETTKETDPTETTKAPSVTPPTGDTSGVGVWMVVMAASAVLLCLMAAVMALLGRKSKSRR